MNIHMYRILFFILVFQLDMVESFAQNDVVIGSFYQLNLQRQTDNADAYVLHNSKVDAASAPVFRWQTTHPSFGSRGIVFSYFNGIQFFADGVASTAGSSFTPPIRMVIRNDGKIGMGTTNPIKKLHLSGTGDVEQWIETTDDGYASLTLKSNGKQWHWSKRPGTFGDVLSLYYHNGTAWNSPYVTFLTDGRMGIGTITPDRALTINSPNTANSLNIKASNGSGEILMGFDQNGGVVSTMTNHDLQLRAGANQSYMTIKANGNIGIGTSSPNEKLTVNGTIYGKEVKVDLSVPGPDYVFEKDYKLPSLEELRAYIELYKHLPEVPSAKEMEENGINVGEMNMILLKKVEELTLYLLQQQKQLEEQREETRLLKIRSNNLERGDVSPK